MQTNSEDDDSGAPDPAVYENQSGGVMEIKTGKGNVADLSVWHEDRK